MTREKLIRKLKEIRNELKRNYSSIEIISKNPNYTKKADELLNKAHHDGYSTIEIAAGLYHGKRR